MKGSLIAALAAIACAAARGGANVPQMSARLSAADAAVTGAPTSTAVVAESRSAQSTRAAQPPGRGRGRQSKGARKSSVPEYREVLLPAGTALSLELQSRLGSNWNQVEDVVRATLRERIQLDGETVLPAGTLLVGHVTDVERSGRVKGRARLELRFTVLMYDGEEYDLSSQTIERVADSTVTGDAAKIGIGTGAGAAVGAILGGGSGAAKGAAIGAAAGTGTVLATRGDDVHLQIGEVLNTQLTKSLRVRVRVR